jgi:hypothetical protein
MSLSPQMQATRIVNRLLLVVVLRDLSVELRRYTCAAHLDGSKKRNFLLNHTY